MAGAFLVILVMIGALAYFGVLNPKNFLPSRCTFSPEVDCLEANIIGTDPANSDHSVVQFRFRNSVGSTSNFESYIVFIGGDNPNATCNVVPVQLQPGRTAEATCEFDASLLPAGDKAKFEVNMNYSKVDGHYSTPIKGEIYGTVN